MQGAVAEVVPCAHMAWPKGCAPKLPWAVFYEDSSADFCADDSPWARAHEWTVELYERSGDSATEGALERSLARFGPVARYETWIDEEGCLMTAYSFKQFERYGDDDGQD